MWTLKLKEFGYYKDADVARRCSISEMTHSLSCFSERQKVGDVVFKQSGFQSKYVLFRGGCLLPQIRLILLGVSHKVGFFC